MYEDGDPAVTVLKKHFEEIILAMREEEWVKVEVLPLNDRRISITTKGIRELGDRRPGSYDNVENVRRIIKYQVADLLDIPDEASSEQKILDKKIAEFDEEFAKRRGDLDTTLREMRTSLAATERYIFGQAM